MTEITCKCGAVYHEESQRLTMRDKDRADCDLCGATLNQWDGAVMYSYKLVSKTASDELPITPLNPSHQQTDV